MSPEQLQGYEVDHRSDQFAFGIILHEMVTGKHPWPCSQPLDRMHAIIHDELPSSDTGPLLKLVLQRCLAKLPHQRFHTTEDLSLALEQATRPPILKPAKFQPSIAVLPFANVSSDKENEFFSDGLSDEIINALANLPDMKVSGRTSAFFFRGKDVELAEIGRRLNVDHVLEGSVRRAGNRVRVTAQLIKVTDGFHLWSERYDRELNDIFAIQDEITQSIAAALRIKLSFKSSPVRRHEPSLLAYEAYLKARGYWFKGTPESLAHLKHHVDHAIALDPQFALPYFLLGGHYTMLANLGFRPAREVIPLARKAEQEALRAEPSLPEAHALLAVCAGIDFDWNEADRQWEWAMARKPVSRDIRFWYGNHYLLSVGRAAEAVEAMADGVQEDPLNHLYRHHWAVGLRHAGNLEAAEEELRKILGVDPNFPLALGTLGAMLLEQGRWEEALVLTEQAHALMPWRSVYTGQLAAILTLTGAGPRASTLISQLGEGMGYGSSVGLAVYYASCGNLEKAAACAEQSIEERYPRLVPILAPLLRHSPS